MNAAAPGPRIAVLDYGIGNLRSATKALQRCGADARLVTDPAEVGAAAGVVLPGVGAFGRCAEALDRSGLAAVARQTAREALDGGRPFLGICIGMQLLYESSEEAPGAAGLGVLPGVVRLLPGDVKRPQIQWNRLDVRPGAVSLAGAGAEPWVYFVHSYAGPAGPEVVATCDYGGPVTAAVERGRLWALQFHPEKSSRTGLRLLANFVAACREERSAG